MTMATVSNLRHFVTSLLLTIENPDGERHARDNANPFREAKQQTRDALLTLHVLFPNELLPALDLLDRGLISRLRIRSETEDDARAQSRVYDCTGRTSFVNTGRGESPDAGQLSDHNHKNEKSPAQAVSAFTPHAVYLVRSAQNHRAGRSGGSDRYQSTTHYEVRLDAWNCSCPAFTFAAFPAASTQSENEDALTGDKQLLTAKSKIGGLSRGEAIPICKHLLACTLAERCNSVFSGCVVDQEVSIDELAGWAAGWSD